MEVIDCFYQKIRSKYIKICITGEKPRRRTGQAIQPHRGSIDASSSATCPHHPAHAAACLLFRPPREPTPGAWSRAAHEDSVTGQLPRPCNVIGWWLGTPSNSNIKKKVQDNSPITRAFFLWESGAQRVYGG